MKYLDRALDRGNHKLVESSPDLIKSLVTDDVSHGHQVRIPIDAIKLISNAVLEPCAIAHQYTINTLRERIEKDHLTHDQTFGFSEKNL